MSTLRISDAPLLPDVDGTEKIPTGGRGDYTISVDQIKGHIFQDVGKELVGLGNVDNTSDLDKPVSTAQQAALNLKADKTYVDTNLDLKADKTNVYTRSETTLALSQKADLVGGVIPSNQLPSYVDDVVEFTTSTLPIIGESGKIYITTDTNRTWRWSGNQYVEISNGGVSDSTLKLQTPRKIANVDFDGTQDISIPHNNFVDRDAAGAHPASAILDASGKTQQEINNSQLTVMNFGAVGDGITDDSNAFQAAANSVLTGNNIIIPSGAFKFKISKTVDLKGKGLVSQSYHKSATVDSKSSIVISDPASVFTNGAVFVGHVGICSGITAVCPSSTNEAPIVLFDYTGNLTSYIFENINMRGFASLVRTAGMTVLTQFNSINSIGCHDALIDIRGTGDSTTLTLNNVIHQYADGYALRLAGNLYGSTINKLTLETVGGGVYANAWRNCSFDQIWAEDNRGTVKDWVESGVATANDSNNTGIIRCIAGTWTDPTEGGGWGGVKTAHRLTVANSNGAKLQMTYDTIQPLPNSVGTAARHLNLCAAAKNGNTLSDINIKGHSGRINFKNLEADVFGKLDIKRDIGTNASNTASEVGTDYWTLQEKHFTVKDVGSNKSGILFAPALLSYDVTVPSRNENGAYTITKDTTVPVGKYVLAMRVGSHTDNNLRYPHIIVGGFVSTQPILYYIVPRQSGGTWAAYRVATGFDIYLTDQAGTPIDVDRFTIMMTFGLTSFIA